MTCICGIEARWSIKLFTVWSPRLAPGVAGATPTLVISATPLPTELCVCLDCCVAGRLPVGGRSDCCVPGRDVGLEPPSVSTESDSFEARPRNCASQVQRPYTVYTLTVCGVWLRESRHLKARTRGSLISRRRPVGSHGLRRTPRELSDTNNFHGCKERTANSQTYLTVSDTYPTLGVSTKRCFETPVRYNRHHPTLSDTPLRRFQGGMDKNTPRGSHRHVPNS